MALPSHTGDDIVEVMLVMERCRYRVMLATTLPIHAGDGAAETTWPRCNVTAES
jgi:hypothetical protein